MTPFTEQVLSLVSSIPRGKIATYGQIAKLAGKPQGSRGVAWILHSSSRKRGLPWQRVVGAGGKLSFPWESEAYLEQRRRLEREGVEFLPNGRIDLAEFQAKLRAPYTPKPVGDSPKNRGNAGFFRRR